MNAVRSVEIPLKNGIVATIDLSQELINRVRTAFMLDQDADVTDRHLQYYLVSSMKNALEVSDVGR